MNSSMLRSKMFLRFLRPKGDFLWQASVAAGSLLPLSKKQEFSANDRFFAKGFKGIDAIGRLNDSEGEVGGQSSFMSVVLKVYYTSANSFFGGYTLKEGGGAVAMPYVFAGAYFLPEEYTGKAAKAAARAPTEEGI